MENQLQPINLVAQELMEKTIQLAQYQIAYNELLKELQAKEMELKELKETQPETEVEDEEE